MMRTTMTNEELSDAMAHLRQGRRSLLALALDEYLEREHRSSILVRDLAAVEEDLELLEKEAEERERLEEGLEVLAAWTKKTQAELRAEENYRRAVSGLDPRATAKLVAGLKGGSR